MSIPIRNHAPSFPRPASPGNRRLEGVALKEWQRMMGKPPKLPSLRNVLRTSVPTLIADYLLTVGAAGLALYLGGLTKIRVCAPGAWTGYIPATNNNQTCNNGQASAGFNLKGLPAHVAVMSGSDTVKFHTFQRFNAIGLPVFKTDSVYGIVSAPGVPRTRPHYAPIPIVSKPDLPWSGIGSVPMPVAAPVDVKPWPVRHAARNPFLAGMPSVTAPAPVAVIPEVGGGIRVVVIPGRPISIEKPDNPAKPGNPAKPQNPARPIVRARPVAGTREVKLGTNSAHAALFFRLVQSKNVVNEWEDFVEVLFKSLPKFTQNEYGGKDANIAQMALAIVENADQIDGQAFIRGFVEMHIVDAIIGNTWFRGRAQLRNLVSPGMMGSLGPSRAGGFEEYALHVHEVVSEFLDGLWDRIDEWDFY